MLMMATMMAMRITPVAQMMTLTMARARMAMMMADDGGGEDDDDDGDDDEDDDGDDDDDDGDDDGDADGDEDDLEFFSSRAPRRAVVRSSVSSRASLAPDSKQ